MTTAALPPAPPPRDLRPLKHAICARARDFEIAALLDLLASMGYRADDVYFRGHVTETPQPTLVHRIEFAEADGVIAGPDPAVGPAADLGCLTALGAGPDEGPRVLVPPARLGPPAPVTVVVNLGLLSCRSPLPSYFHHLLRDATLQEPLLELLQLIDRDLLRARLTCDRPERLVEHWDQITHDLLRIHGLDSLLGLSWIFRHVFPELPAAVVRTSDGLRVPAASARVGISNLGSACLGALTRIDVHDFEVTLRVEESLQRRGVSWIDEAERRLRTIVFPALAPVCLNLTVLLELVDDRAVAALESATEPARDSYLGLDTLAVPGTDDLPVRRVVLYRGLLPDDPADTDELERALEAGARVEVDEPALTGTSPAPLVGGGRTPDLDRDCALALAVERGGLVHHYQAVVRWGVRDFSRDEPYAVEVHRGPLRQEAPTPRRHPRAWAFLRDHARLHLAWRQLRDRTQHLAALLSAPASPDDDEPTVSGPPPQPR